MSIRRIATVLISLATTASFASGAPLRAISSVTSDRVAHTMSTMRMVSTLLVDQQRREGGYPLADGRLHRVQDVVGSQPGTQTEKLARDGWGHPLWYRAGRAVHELLNRQHCS